MPPWLLPWLPILTLVAAISGPLVAYLVGARNVRTALSNAQAQMKNSLDVARLQVRSSVVSSNRQRWIDALRDELAEFLAERDLLTAKKSDAVQDPVAIRASSSRLIRLFHQLQLRLNPKEQDHARILELASQLAGRPSGPLEDGMVDELVELSQTVLKREWDRVKAGD